MSHYSLIVVVTLAATSMCWGHIERGEMSQNEDVHLLCGRNLARTLAVLCMRLRQGDRDNLLAGKRSEDNLIYNTILSSYYKEQESRQFGWPWLTQKATGLSLPSTDKRSIVQECCNKPCTLDELLSYC